MKARMTKQTIFELLASGDVDSIAYEESEFTLADAGGVTGFEEFRGRSVLKEIRPEWEHSRFHWKYITGGGELIQTEARD